MTRMEHAAPAASVNGSGPQFAVSLNTDALVPLSAMAVTTRLALPLLLTPRLRFATVPAGVAAKGTDA